jgi:hypothetical protein
MFLMSEKPQPPFSQPDPVQAPPNLPTEKLRNKVSAAAYFQDYIDLDSDSSGIFGHLDVEAAKQAIKQMPQ